MKISKTIKLTDNGFSKFYKNGKAMLSNGPGNSVLSYFPETNEYVLQKGRCASGRCQTEVIYKGKNKALINKMIKEIFIHYNG